MSATATTAAESPAELALVDEHLLAVATYGLPGSVVQLPEGVLSDEEWSALVAGCEEHGLIGLLAAAVSSGDLAATDTQRQDVAERHLAAMAGTLALEHTLVGITDALDEAGVDYRVLKGTAVAHLDYTDPALRCFGDIDLLLLGSDFGQVQRLVGRSGARRRSRDVRQGFAGRFGKSATYVTTDGHEVDFHRTFAHGYFGFTVPLEDVWMGGESFTLAGRTLRALAPEERLMHAAYNTVLSATGPRLSNLRDVAEMALYGRFSNGRLRGVAAAWRADAILAEAVRHTWTVFRIADVTALSRWAERYEPSKHDRQVMALYTRAETPYAAHARTSLESISGLRAKAAFVASLAVPDHEFLAERGMTRKSWLARGLGRVRRATVKSPT